MKTPESREGRVILLGLLGNNVISVPTNDANTGLIKFCGLELKPVFAVTDASIFSSFVRSFLTKQALNFIKHVGCDGLVFHPFADEFLHLLQLHGRDRGTLRVNFDVVAREYH